MSRYTAVTDADLELMLEAIGVDSVEALFAGIPAAVRLERELALPDGLSEQDVYSHLRELAARNVSAEDELCFLGAGMYDHYVPAIVDMLMSRSEFLTPYTPYQPEISQGGLQVMFEYQTAICELTGLPVSHASVYEGPSALAAAGYLAKLTNGRRRFVTSRGLHPHARETLETLSEGYGTTVDEVALAGGVTDPEAWTDAIDDDVSAVFVAQPNFLGAVEDLAPLIAAAHEHGALVVCMADPLTLGVLEAPGVLGVDVCVGEGQTLGNRLDFGGPSFGFFGAREELLRRMPGRIAGETVDRDGRRGFVLTLQTREQHIRREKATSNICTAQALNALAGVVYLCWLGRRGIVELGELLVRRTAYARDALCAINGVSALHAEPVVREFALRLDAPVHAVIERCAGEGVNPGYELGLDYEEHADGLLVAVTEQRSRADIDRLCDVLGRAVAAERSSAPVAVSG
ncbi:MAG: aminomethyl-transferring glycine dehydrogenase subunit GcvPA [Solirubrobacteraceae bacterium]